MNKKVIYTIGFLSLFAILTSCGNNDNNPKPTPDQDPTPVVKGPGIKIHYNRKDGEYKNWALWLWENAPGGVGKEYTFNGSDDYGAYAFYTFEDLGSSTILNNGLGFIVKSLGTWNSKDPDGDRFIDFKQLKQDENEIYHVYLKSNDPQVYTDPIGTVNDELKYFDIVYNSTTNQTKIWFQTNNSVSYFNFMCNGVSFAKNENCDLTKFVYTFETNEEVSILNDYTLKVIFLKSKKEAVYAANKRQLFSTPSFNNKFNYDGELGAIYTANSTVFKVWSPLSSSIKLRIYSNGTPKSIDSTLGDDAYEEYDMTLGEKGVFSHELSGDLAGKFYTYVVTNSNYKDTEIVDPYAKSSGINGLRGMIVDFSKTNPDGWSTTKINEVKKTKLTVYETHIADLTSSKTWNGKTANKKLYNGAHESGTVYKDNDGNIYKTGFDHIKELGVNAMQIIPFFDQANDERPGKVTFNWGYNPLNYNVVEGCYSSNPYDGYTKIREMKSLIQDYINNGVNIIMDVVFNHVNSLNNSNFDVLMPGYYFRYSAGKPSNGSGCGNETASEMPMYRKFMIDSASFWAKEYKIGGFRFDLMGVHDIETMNLLVKKVHEINQYITVYGEPWAGGTINLGDAYKAANQAHMNNYEDYSSFNDVFRDAIIKGGLKSSSEKGWVMTTTSSNSLDKSDIIKGIKGETGTICNDPTKSIAYVTCHDNYTLKDRMAAAGYTNEELIKKMAMSANSLVFTSQGISFMLAGEEFLRTKQGNNNSYDSSYEVNELDYSLLEKNNDMFENYKKLIKFKQNIDGLNLMSSEEVSNTLSFEETDVNAISYSFNSDNKTYKVVHLNGDSTKTNNYFDFNGYNLYLDTLNKKDLVLSSKTALEPFQTIIAFK